MNNNRLHNLFSITIGILAIVILIAAVVYTYTYFNGDCSALLNYPTRNLPTRCLEYFGQ